MKKTYIKIVSCVTMLSCGALSLFAIEPTLPSVDSSAVSVNGIQEETSADEEDQMMVMEEQVFDPNTETIPPISSSQEVTVEQPSSQVVCEKSVAFKLLQPTQKMKKPENLVKQLVKKLQKEIKPEEKSPNLGLILIDEGDHFFSRRSQPSEDSTITHSFIIAPRYFVANRSPSRSSFNDCSKYNG
ncbi:MAG: hypothetical protein AAF335_02540 [Bacteroidota bacterium]